MLNVAAVAPAATVTEAGAVNTGDALLVSVTMAPPAGAACESVTLQVVAAFDDSVLAEQESAVTAGRICSDTVAVADPFRVAVRVTVWLSARTPVETLNVPVVAPAGTVTDGGAASTVAALFVIVTTAPPAGAAAEIVTAQSVLWFEFSVASVQDSAVTEGGAVNDTVAFADVPFRAAVRVAVWLAEMIPVEMLNVPPAAPATIVTDAGAARPGAALLVNVTTAPPARAGTERLMVQIVLWLDNSVVSVQVSPVTPGRGMRATSAAAWVPFNVAVSVAVRLAATAAVEMVNVAVVARAATATDVGAVNVAAWVLVNVTVAPPARAAFESVTVQVVLEFGDKVVSTQASALTVGGVTSDSVAVAVVPFSAAVRVAD